ncbi:MAG: flagellar biosynthesis protein FliQ [Deltaproteobacteria bacterium]|jgi:flagellar biosynthetic protein FliQ|nr:flagellar biosynthesis protein FliQ [Deltaproteobacteria bacterium]
MGVENLKEIFLNFFMAILITAGPVLLVSLLVGLIISFLQAVTQIQEFTLTFVPKIIAVFVCFYLMLPWMARTLTQYTREVIENIPLYIK